MDQKYALLRMTRGLAKRLTPSVGPVMGAAPAGCNSCVSARWAKREQKSLGFTGPRRGRESSSGWR